MSQIEELRQILVGDNTAELEKLRDRINNLDQRTRDVAEVLAPAIDAGIKENDDLVNSLTGPVSHSLKRAVRAEPDNYADILYPVMAPAIRKSIAQAISSLMVTINQTMASATSAEGIGMRIQSWRTGVPYAQLALRKSLKYRVEHVYLIERESGMMVAESGVEESGTLDSDAVSAMFAAIQSFVQDSFSQRDDDRLTDLKVGEYNVWIAHGRKLMLACVIDGDPPESLKNDMYDVLDGIRADFANEIEDFDGDSSAFDGVEPRLQLLLQSQLKEELADEDDAGHGISVKAVVFSLLGLAIIGYLVYDRVSSAAQRQTVEHYLKQTPGLAVTRTYWNDDVIVVEGLQDPDAEIPYALFAAHRIEPAMLSLQTIPFRSLDAEMEMQRFTRELAPPPPLRFAFEDGRLSLAGEAPIGWLLRHNLRLRQLAVDKRLLINELRASNASVSAYIAANFGSLDEPARAARQAALSGKPWLEINVADIAE